MEFFISNYEFLKHLQCVNSVINNNNILPILSNFLFEIDKNKIIITGSDLESTIIIEININYYLNKFKFIIPAKLLTNIIKILPEQNIKFNINNNKNIIEIISKQGIYTFSIQNGDEYPKEENIINNSYHKISIDNKILLNIIDNTIFATGIDDLRPVMTGVFFSFTTNESIFVATDTNKLVKFSIKNLIVKKNFNCIIPKKTLFLLKNIINSDNLEINKSIKIIYNHINIIFCFNNKKIICRLINGKFPNYDAVIPNNSINNKILIIDRILFLNSIKRISLFTNRITHQICLNIFNNTIIIYANDKDFSNKGYEKIVCDYKYNNITIGFNVKFLIDIITHINTEKIILQIYKANKPVIIKPLIQDSKLHNEQIIMILMPIVINE